MAIFPLGSPQCVGGGGQLGCRPPFSSLLLMSSARPLFSSSSSMPFRQRSNMTLESDKEGEQDGWEGHLKMPARQQPPRRYPQPKRPAGFSAAQRLPAWLNRAECASLRAAGCVCQREIGVVLPAIPAPAPHLARPTPRRTCCPYATVPRVSLSCEVPASMVVC